MRSLWIYQWTLGSIVANLQSVQWIEIDIPRCSLTWGLGACTASLNSFYPRKCHDTFSTCAVKQVYSSTVQTMVLFPPVTNAPIGSFPCLDGGISETEATVNIAGADPNMSAFGRRGTVEFNCSDMTDNDVWFDKYWKDRVDGSGQIDEAGYNPESRGTLFSKLKARWPYFSGRSCRVKDGFLLDGVLTTTATRHYILTDFETTTRGKASFKGRDVLDLAGSSRALAPKPCRGKASSEVSALVGAIVTLQPAGIGGDDYGLSGRALIGSEIVSFTRSGDIMTLTGRGLSGTVATSHPALATVQQTLRYDGVRADLVVHDLMTNFATVPASSIDLAAWNTEMLLGAPAVLLTAEICNPEDVSKLVAEISLIGPSFFWNTDDQTVGIKSTRPVYDDVTYEITDDDILKGSVGIKSRDDKRFTAALFQSVQIDPVKGIADDNFLQYEYRIDGDAQSPDAYGDSRLKIEKVRWLNAGNDAAMRAIVIRYMNRFRDAPEHVTVTVRQDMYQGLRLADVVYLTTVMRTDATGKAARQSYQVISKRRSGAGLVELVLQRYRYEGRFARVLQAGDAATYDTATDEQRGRGGYLVSELDPVFPEGTGPYVFA